MTKPDVTYILCTYNHEAFVEEALESAFRQDYSGVVQYIFLDDGSKDRTCAIAREVFSRYPNLWIEDLSDGVNRGLCVNLNRAIKVSQGGIVFFHSCDDVADVCRIRVFTSAYDSNPTWVGCYGDVRRIDENGRLLSESFCGKHSQESIKRRVEAEGRFPCVVGPNATILRSAFEKVGYLDETPGAAEDLQMSVMMLWLGDVGYIEAPNLSYRIHSSNWSSAGGSMFAGGFDKWVKNARMAYASALAAKRIGERDCDSIGKSSRGELLHRRATRECVNSSIPLRAFCPMRGDGFYRDVWKWRGSLSLFVFWLVVRVFGRRGYGVFSWMKSGFSRFI